MVAPQADGTEVKGGLHLDSATPSLKGGRRTTVVDLPPGAALAVVGAHVRINWSLRVCDLIN
jgi:hypothetical protein